jgi:ABC-2 type transport system ATP-binding protein
MVTVELAIRIRGLRKSFGERQVLAGIDLDVAPGIVFALLGPNGAGKTTLIRILSTLTPPDGGAAWVAGHNVVTEATNVKQSISLTGQQAAVDEVLSGRENLVMVARLAGFSRRQAAARATELLAQFELEDAADTRVKSYSGGMRRRLDLAISLTASPPVVFLDEPTTGMDTRGRQALWSMITSLARQGITIFLTTQYLEEADQLADRIAVIDGGVVVAEGTAAELKASIGGDVVEIRSTEDELLREIATNGTAAGLRGVIEGIDAAQLPELRVTIRKPTMDDVFLALTGAGPRTQTQSQPELEESRT